MAKAPTPGSTKTRLAAELGFDIAARLYECFMLDTLDAIRSVDDATPLVAMWPPDSVEYFERIAPGFRHIEQQGDSLRARLAHVLTAAFDLGFVHALAVSTDNPTLPCSLLADGVARLRDAEIDVVLGPALDGGYYLIGVKSPPGRLVSDVEMSNPNVLRNTLDLATELDLRVSLLDPWYDIDEPHDLDRLRAELAGDGTTASHTCALLDEIGYFE